MAVIRETYIVYAYFDLNKKSLDRYHALSGKHNRTCWGTLGEKGTSSCFKKEENARGFIEDARGTLTDRFELIRESLESLSI